MIAVRQWTTLAVCPRLATALALIRLSKSRAKNTVGRGDRT